MRQRNFRFNKNLSTLRIQAKKQIRQQEVDNPRDYYKHCCNNCINCYCGRIDRQKRKQQNDTQSAISSTVQETTADKSVSLNDNSEFQEKLKSESEKSIKNMQDKYTELSNDIGGTYKGYKKNTEKVNEWYSFCESEAKSYYVTVSQYCYSYYKNVADNKSDYTTWSRSMEDGYKIWQRETEDFYKAWSRMYESAFKELDGIITKAYDEASYDEVSSAYSDMYNAYEDAYSNMYDTYEDAYSDSYDFYQDVWEELYDGKEDIKSKYDNIYKK